VAAQRKPNESQPPQRPTAAEAVEVLRLAQFPPPAPDRGEEKASLFWRIFGGTVLSIVALVIMAAYQQITSTLSELRAAQTHLNEASADLARKSDLEARSASIWGSLKDLPALKTRNDQLEAELKSGEQERKEMQERLNKLSERVAVLEARRAAAPGAAKERVTRVVALSSPAGPPGPPTAEEDSRVVTVEKAEVRSRPNEERADDVTNVLARGARVEVVEALPDGWWGIRPPSGSFSWINTRLVQRIDGDLLSVSIPPDSEAPVFPGNSARRDRRPTVVGAKLKRGTVVSRIGPTLTDAEGAWIPIEPPAGEARYLRASAVRKRAP
jgi:hypothetical protein